MLCKTARRDDLQEATADDRSDAVDIAAAVAAMLKMMLICSCLRLTLNTHIIIIAGKGYQ